MLASQVGLLGNPEPTNWSKRSAKYNGEYWRTPNSIVLKTVARSTNVLAERNVLSAGYFVG